jgi:hypothetical protein
MADSAVIIKTRGLMRYRWRSTETPDERDWPVGEWVSGGDSGSRYPNTDDARRDARRLTRDLSRDELFWATVQVWLVSPDDRLTRLIAEYRLDVVDSLDAVA